MDNTSDRCLVDFRMKIPLYRFLAYLALAAPPPFAAIVTAMNYRFHWRLPIWVFCILMPVFAGAVLGLSLDWPWRKRLLVVLSYVVFSFFVSGLVVFFVAGLNGDAL